MNVKLRDMAPWNEVTLNDNFVVTKSWKLDDGTHDFSPIAAYVEYQSDTNDYSSMTKAELVEIAKNMGLSITGLSKADLIEAINGAK